MKSFFRCSVVTLIILFFITVPVMGEVDWKRLDTLDVNGTPIDVAVSINGQWIYILTDQGEIFVHSGQGEFRGIVPVGKHIDGISASPWDDIILGKSKLRKQVEILSIDVIRNIDTTGAPFKGEKEASVELVQMRRHTRRASSTHLRHGRSLFLKHTCVHVYMCEQICRLDGRER